MSDKRAIDEQQYIKRRVIDLAEIRVARGMSRRPTNLCKHKRLVYDVQERRVWCQDCESTVDNFDALMVLVGSFESMTNAAMKMLDEAEAAKSAIIHRIAARDVEAIWRRKMAVSCPHCHHGILPDDALGMVSADLERARRDGWGRG